MTKSGLVTETVEVVKHVQLDLSIDEVYKLRDCLETAQIIPFHIYRSLDAVIKEYERLTGQK